MAAKLAAYNRSLEDRRQRKPVCGRTWSKNETWTVPTVRTAYFDGRFLTFYQMQAAIFAATPRMSTTQCCNSYFSTGRWGEGGKTDRGGKLFISRSMEMDIVLSRGWIIKCASCRNEFFFKQSVAGWFAVCREEESVRDNCRKGGQIYEGLLIKTN